MSGFLDQVEILGMTDSVVAEPCYIQGVYRAYTGRIQGAKVDLIIQVYERKMTEIEGYLRGHRRRITNS